MKKVLIKLIDLYQATPLHCHTLCRFTPTCSEYMKQSIEINGYKGIIKGIKRILRCNPFCKSGYDPVIKEENI
ncbi:MAG: membrane protein insertion efficiency factor YidD [Tenericutes bacterium]|nr:membrane protein insertion efficiency factor YidD [Mycoplasmatota bacterium]